MKTATRIAIAVLALTLAPNFASAQPTAPGVHSRSVTIHDRSPKPHSHESVAHH